MNILVTGGAGFIGSHLVDQLVEEGHTVRVLDNLHRGKKANIQKHLDSGAIEFWEKDIRDYQQIAEAFNNQEVVFHLAAQSNVLGAVQDIDYSFQTNVDGTFNVLKASKRHGVRRVIFTSSREAYGEAQYLPVDEKHPLLAKNSYGASKVAGEVYCRVFQNMGDLEMVVLRLANVYGERDFDRVIPIFVNNVLQGKDIQIFGGKQIIDFISVEIVVKTLLAAINNKRALSGPINVGSGKGTNLFQLAAKIMSLIRGKSRILVAPARQVEVVKFTADIKRFKKVFKIHVPEDPLYYLPGMIERMRVMT